MNALSPDAQAKQQRRRDLFLIHKGKASLGLSDDDYRALLQTVTGQTSAATLNGAQRRKVLDHLATLGVKTHKKPFDQAAKIAWLWKKLDQAQALKDPSRSALLAFIGRTAGMAVSDPKFLPVAEASKVIEALKAWLNRAQSGKRGHTA